MSQEEELVGPEPQERLLVIGEKLFTALMEGPVKAHILKNGKVPVVNWGEPHTQKITFYAPIVTLEDIEK